MAALAFPWHQPYIHMSLSDLPLEVGFNDKYTEFYHFLPFFTTLLITFFTVVYCVDLQYFKLFILNFENNEL